MTKTFYCYYNKSTLSDVAERFIESQNYDEIRILTRTADKKKVVRESKTLL
jgi:hypothetical protein